VETDFTPIAMKESPWYHHGWIAVIPTACRLASRANAFEMQITQPASGTLELLVMVPDISYCNAIFSTGRF
jgi:hypothetical protein